MTTPAASWDAQFQELRTRFARVKDSIVYAIHALQTNPDIALEDLKAQAAMHDIRVTAASVRAARRLMAGGRPAVEPAPRALAEAGDDGMPAAVNDDAATGDSSSDTIGKSGPAGRAADPDDFTPPATPTRRARVRVGAASSPDPSTLIRQLVGEIEERGEAEAERLRNAMRQAIAILQAAVDG